MHRVQRADRISANALGIEEPELASFPSGPPMQCFCRVIPRSLQHCRGDRRQNFARTLAPQHAVRRLDHEVIWKGL